ncbi:hypothetical protein EG68_08924 [Paragonimus skrjabini miyazakii]|uniref:Uncharacterized protein n=1 Tax=Paragonimus skrjabini miyazakii TaxID=59628 RepID=A0A8S9YN78_9TREM|nr:hypothetical protein EG68_08924 [Paragonimus skrjabini miyazakii]
MTFSIDFSPLSGQLLVCHLGRKIKMWFQHIHCYFACLLISVLLLTYIVPVTGNCCFELPTDHWKKLNCPGRSVQWFRHTEYAVGYAFLSTNLSAKLFTKHMSESSAFYAYDVGESGYRFTDYAHMFVVKGDFKRDMFRLVCCCYEGRQVLIHELSETVKNRKRRKITSRGNQKTSEIKKH